MSPFADARRALDATGVLVVGEPHGKAATPPFVLRLMRELDATALGLEWSHDEVDETLQRFVRDGVLDLHGIPPTAEIFNGDGRALEEHLELLQALREEGRLQQLIAFDRLDREGQTWEDRDREMAERVLEQWDRRNRLVVLTGGFHAQLECADGQTMAMRLARELPGLQTAMLAYADVDGLPATPIAFRLPASGAGRGLRSSAGSRGPVRRSQRSRPHPSSG